MNKFLKKTLSFSLAALLTIGMSATAVYANDDTNPGTGSGDTGTDEAPAEGEGTGSEGGGEAGGGSGSETGGNTGEGAETGGSKGNETPKFDGVFPKDLTVTGISAGDTVKFYRVIKHSSTEGAETSGWIAEDAFKAGAGDEALTEAQIRQMIGIGEDGKPITGGLDSVLAGKIAAIIANKSLQPAYTATAVAKNGTVTASYAITDEDQFGLYVAFVISSDPQYTYNPVFVAASGNTTWNQNVETGVMSYSDTAMTKKELITVEKTAVDEKTVDTSGTTYDPKSETVSAGDVIDFTVETKIPLFSSAYKYATYQVADYLTEGLKLVKDSVKVSVKPTSKNPAAGKDYTIKQDDHSYNIVFDKDYLLGLGKAQNPENPTALVVTPDLTVTYQATVSSAALYNVNGDSNTVIISFSKDPAYDGLRNKLNPDFDSSKPEGPDNPRYLDEKEADPDPTNNQPLAKLIDKTNHYTFNIDGKLLGDVTEPDPNFVSTPENPNPKNVPWLTTEVVKVALDEHGNEYKIDDGKGNDVGTRNLHSNQNIGALEGALFTLYVKGTDGKMTPYGNSILEAKTMHIESDENGRLRIVGQSEPGIRGLDAGTYYLREEKAPAGYIVHQGDVEIVITPKYSNNKQKVIDNGQTLEVESKLLVSYEVTIGGVKTAEYEIINNYDEGFAANSNNGTTATAVKLQSTAEQPTNYGDNITGANGLIVQTPEKSSAATFAGKITNVRGTALPETGGIGTRMFYVIGGALAVGAGILLVAKKRIA